MDKDLRKIAKALREQGFETEINRKGHLQVYREGRLVTTFSGTPSDWRALRNALSQAKRAGFIWPPNR